MNKRLIAGVVGAIVVGTGIYVFMGQSSEVKIRLVTEKMTRSTISNMVTATGTVEPITQVEVGTQVSGIIDRIYVDFNSRVTKGQLIAEMDKVTLQSELVSKEADLASSKTEFEYQQKNYVRSKTLHEKNLISDTDYETATYTYEKSRSTYERYQADLVKVKRNLGYATITSPIDGVVISRAVEEGQTVAAGFSTPTLFTIANDLTQMEVIANVDEADIGQVEEGQRVTFAVDAYPNDVFEGNVTQVRLEATTTSNVVTYEVVINAPNPDLKLKPGLTANVTIYTLEKNNILAVPGKALRFVPDAALLAQLGLTVVPQPESVPTGKKLIWQQKGQTLQPKMITVGSTGGSVIEVTAGLQEGEEFIVGITDNIAVPESAATQEQSPFMPQRPGANKNK